MQPVVLDAFEYGVLIEAAWHSGTILRFSIMQRAIDNWYKLLTKEEIARTFEFFNRTKGKDAKQDIQKRFLARYNPASQAKVTVKYDGKTEVKEAYFYENKYWIDSMRSISDEYIVCVEADNSGRILPTENYQIKAKVIDRSIIHSLKELIFSEFDIVAKMKFSQTEQGALYIDCKIEYFGEPTDEYFTKIKDMQRNTIGAEFISEFYTEETGHWKIFLKGC